MTLRRPDYLFGRSADWEELVDFVEGPTRLGVVWGPRRAGKSTLLASLADASGGLYYEAVRQDSHLSLAELGRLVGDRLGGGRVSYSDWSEAITALASLPRCPVVVIDEFGYLCEASPELPSVVQRVIDAGRRTSQSCRIIVCGSSVSQLSHLLDRDQPLFGRAQLAAVVDPFDFREAARFWDIDGDPRLAFQLHAVFGGLPGYRDVVTSPPQSSRTFDAWVGRSVLSPASPLLEEDALVLYAAGLDSNVYRSIVTAVALGGHTPTGVASRVGRPASALARPFEKLTEARLLTRIPDPLRSRRSTYRLADPFLTFHDAIIRPNRARIRRRAGGEVWEEARPTWLAQILGPHFEQLCREATALHGEEFGVAGATTVGATKVSDPRARRSHEIDVVAADRHGHITAIGEAKYTNARRDLADLERLDHIRSLLPNADDRPASIAIFSAAGFTTRLQRAAAHRPDVALVSLEQLYGHRATKS